MPNQEAITGAIGPMAVSARDCELFIKVVLAAQPWKLDPSVLRQPWRPEEVSFVGGAKPRIGVMWNDGVVVPQPPMRRALAAAVEQLKAKGYEVVDFKPHRTAEAWALLKKLYFTDGGARVKNMSAATGEPVLELTQWIMEGARDTPASEVFDLVGQREKFRAEYAEYWESQGIDVLLCPPMPGPAAKRLTSRYWMYTAMFNLLDYPGAVFPTGLVVDPKNAGDAKDAEREWLSADDKAQAELYSPEVMVGAPVCLQLVGPRTEDEKLMEAFKIISKDAQLA